MGDLLVAAAAAWNWARSQDASTWAAVAAAFSALASGLSATVAYLLYRPRAHVGHLWTKHAAESRHSFRFGLALGASGPRPVSVELVKAQIAGTRLEGEAVGQGCSFIDVPSLRAKRVPGEAPAYLTHPVFVPPGSTLEYTAAVGPLGAEAMSDGGTLYFRVDCRHRLLRVRLRPWHRPAR